MSFIQELKLTDFRCYESLVLSDLSPGGVILYGRNGAGKTNLLEAVSFLSPGRGLRNAKLNEVQRIGSRSNDFWAISARLHSDFGDIQVGTGADQRVRNRRAVRVNGASAKSQSVLSEYLACIWLTPQMDRLFIEGASYRRRFLDRLILSFDIAHTGRLTRYENAMRQRSKLLQSKENVESSWLDALESSMAETGVSISAARLLFLEKLQTMCDKAASSVFPKAIIDISGAIEELLKKAPAVEVEELFKYQLLNGREQDSLMGGAVTGPHKSDLLTWFSDKNMKAELSSTGEQKALLISIILAYSRLISLERGAPPILLLDEVAAHLDENRRENLYELLFSLGGQVWMTGTDKSLFSSIIQKSSVFELEDSKVVLKESSAAA
jgi:DNA replication and repair protein RecF